MSDSFKICFLADRHSLYDDRIYWKMAVPLKERGHKVHYLLIGNKAEVGTTKEGIAFQMFELKTFSRNRYLNFVLKRLNPNNNYKKLFEAASVLEADIYHFHDLWINRIGKRLKALRHKPVVFYDAREPYAEDYTSYVNTWPGFGFLIHLFASFVDRWEKRQARHYDLVIANEETVREHFARKIGMARTAVIYNYPDLHPDNQPVSFEDKKYDLIYCGGISELRGAYMILKALKKARTQKDDIQLAFLGNYYPPGLKQEMHAYLVQNDLTQNVHLLDAVPYRQVADYYKQSKIGLVLLQPVKTFEVSLPIKIFEYMMFGLPVIGSDFGHIRKYISMDRCGVLVSPEDTDQIAKAMSKILLNRDLYNQYSENGRKAATSKYRWEGEFKKLMDHYKRALDGR